VNFLFTVGVLIVVLGVLIFVHELGHFLAAKWAGIRVHRFALGMGNPIPGLKRTRGNTEYAICWLPLGGYVKMASREEEATSSVLEGAGPPAGAEPVRPEEYYEAKPVWKRVIVILAGVTMNILFAWAIYTYLAWRVGERIDPETRVGEVVADSLPPGGEALATLRPGDRIRSVNGAPVSSWNAIVEGIFGAAGDSIVLGLEDGRSVVLRVHHSALTERAKLVAALRPWDRPVVDYFEKGRPGERAGLAPGDTLVALGGEPVTSVDGLIQRIRSNPGVPLTVEVARDSGRVQLIMTPDTVQENGELVGKVGVAFRADTDFQSRPYPILEAVRVGFSSTVVASTVIVRTVQGLLSARISSREVGGPIMIGQVAAQRARAGLLAFLEILALISVNLAVLNLLPIPILDGGQFLFLVAEGIMRRPVPERIRSALMMVGLLLIAALMILAFWNDFARLFGWR